jgi:putative PIN family toxin of toxin-antitoxin system
VYRVVLDTVVFVRSLINPHGIWGKLVFAHDYRLFVSKPVVTEILEVLSRPELTQKFRTLRDMDIARVIEILGQSEFIDIPSIPTISRDVKDDKFLATAEIAQADYLVTEDKDLLVLNEHKGTLIIDAATFLRILEQQESSTDPQ